MRSKLYAILFIVSVTLLSSRASFAQRGFFTHPGKESISRLTTDGLGKFSLHTIDVSGLQRYLAAAPAEHHRINAGALQLEIPLPNGTAETFDIFASSVLAPEQAALHPEITTFSGKGRQHPGYKLRLSITPEGFSAIILGVEGDVVFFERMKAGTKEPVYQSYFSKDAAQAKKSEGAGNRCVGTENSKFRATNKITSGITTNSLTPEFSIGTELRTFRIAVAATAEFTASRGGQSAAYSAIVAYVNEMNAVYESELSVRFSLVSGTNLIYTNAGSDPYTANDQGVMLDENQANLDAVIGSANYDLGHVLGDGGPGSGGGVAVRPSVCDNTTKGMGASDVGDEQNYSHVFTVQLIAHEIGHQFGMSHTYNSNIPVCTTRAHETSVEPGSGATIMSYGFTCGSDDYSDEYDGSNKKIGPFLNFHVASLRQALIYIQSTSCFTTSASTNNVPVINAGATSFTIPKSTPFTLSATATDADGGPLTYSWEGTNTSNIPNKADVTPALLESDTSAPFFRSYSPLTSGSRTYPILSAILDGSNKSRGDKLPGIAITTTHTLTVRDNAGGVVTEDVTVTIDDAGPFLITNDPTGTLAAASTTTIQWSVNGTNASPINCTLVDILLSTDGGQTFPTTLATAVPNSGMANVTLPNVSTTQARIKIIPSTSTASGNIPNIFFDISNQNFTISSTLPVTLLSFDAKLSAQNGVMLFWKTSQEINNKGFEVEISTDGRQFTKLGYVNGAGNASEAQQYQFPVNDLARGTYFFRLRQVDIDGSHSYSKLLKVTINASAQPAVVYPNPANNNVSIDPGKYAEQVFSIKIVNQVGQVMQFYPAQKYAAGFELKTNSLPKGIYHVILTGSGFQETIKVVKL